MDEPRIALVGAGAVAGLVASWLELAGAPTPLLCTRTPVEQLTITGDGRGGRGTRTVPVTPVPGPADAEPVDWVMLTVKAQDTAATQPWLDALVGPDTVVVVLQNGVDHVERVQPLVGTATVLPALVRASAERTGSGAVTHHLGNQLIVPEEPAGKSLAALLDGGASVRQDPDFRTAAWHKLMVNIGSNPLTALTLRRCEVLREPEVAELCRSLLIETAAVGSSVGARLSGADVEEVLELFRSYPDDNGTSMYYDRVAGRPLEHDLLCGAVVRAAQEHDVPAPLNQAIWALTKALSEGSTGNTPTEGNP